MLGLLPPGYFEFGMAPPLRFGLLFPLFSGQKELGEDFPVCIRLPLPGRHEFLCRRFAKLICLQLMMRLGVVSLSNGHVDARCRRERNKPHYSTLSAEDATVG